MLAAVTLVMALAATAFTRGDQLLVVTWIYPLGTLVESVYCFAAARAARRTGIVPAQRLRRAFAIAISWELAGGLAAGLAIVAAYGSLLLGAEILFTAATMAVVLRMGRQALRPAGSVTPPA